MEIQSGYGQLRALKLTVPPTGLIHPSPSSRIDHFPNTLYIYIYHSCTRISCHNKTNEMWTMAFVSSCSFEDFAWVEREREIEWMLFLLSFKNHGGAEFSESISVPCSRSLLLQNYRIGEKEGSISVGWREQDRTRSRGSKGNPNVKSIARSVKRKKKTEEEERRGRFVALLKPFHSVLGRRELPAFSQESALLRVENELWRTRLRETSSTCLSPHPRVSIDG